MAARPVPVPINRQFVPTGVVSSQVITSAPLALPVSSAPVISSNLGQSGYNQQLNQKVDQSTTQSIISTYPQSTGLPVSQTVPQIDARIVTTVPTTLSNTRLPRSEFRDAIIARLAGNLVTTQEARTANQQALTIESTPEAKSKVQEFQQAQLNIERQYFDLSQTCPVGIRDELRDRLSSLDPKSFKSKIMDHFYDPQLMQAALCVTDAIVYSAPIQAGLVPSNYRIRHWMTGLQQIGAESVTGYALSASITNPKKNKDPRVYTDANNTFIIKAPRHERSMLVHEYFVGMFGLNKVRSKVPNFAYIMGGFKCSPPVIDQNNKEVVAFCNNTNYPIDYIIYENIAPSISLREAVKKGCTFSQWLSYYVQVLYALSVAQDMVDFTHYDLHDENILVRDISHNGGKMSISGTSNFAIPYPTERVIGGQAKTEYVITDKVATIIDFDISHIKYEGKDFGAYHLLPYGVLPRRSFPLFDAYKLLLMSMRTMFISKNEDCFNKATNILRFFNQTESAKAIIEGQGPLYYYLPYNDRTSNLGVLDLAQYIRKTFDTDSIITETRPIGMRILGCDGTDVCSIPSTSGVLANINSYGIVANNVFDFYDLHSRLAVENQDKATALKKSFNYEEKIPFAKQQYNQDLKNVTNVDDKLRSGTIQANGIQLNILLTMDYLMHYRSYITLVADVYNTLQDVDSLYNSITYTAAEFGDTVTKKQIEESYSLFRSGFDRIWNATLRNIQTDIFYIRSLATVPQYLTEINKAIQQNPSYSWYWNGLPDIFKVVGYLQ